MMEKIKPGEFTILNVVIDLSQAKEGSCGYSKQHEGEDHSDFAAPPISGAKSVVDAQ